MTPVSPAPARKLDAAAVLDAANRLVEADGLAGLTMRRLADELGVAVTAIYWHVGNRDAVLDGLVDRLLAEMGTVTARGRDPRARIGSLARGWRRVLLSKPELVGLAHQRDRTPAMFQPIRAQVAVELAALGLRGRSAALAMRTIESHVVASVILVQAIRRNAGHEVIDLAAWPGGVDDPELEAALAEPVDREELFEYGLECLLANLGR